MRVRWRWPACLESQWVRRFRLALQEIEPRLSEFEASMIASSQFAQWGDMDPEQAAEDYADELPRAGRPS